MSDLVLGIIIGGVIGLVGSAIQAYTSIKGKREDNLARQQEQAIRIQHERDSQFLSRRIAVRSRYLEPMTTDLSGFYASLNQYKHELVGLITPYSRAEGPTEDQVQVHEADKQEFIRTLEEISTKYEAVRIAYHRLRDSHSPADIQLVRLIRNIAKAVGDFYEGLADMYRSLAGCRRDQDFVYDFKAIFESIDKLLLSISQTHNRIEDLLAGAD